MNDDAKTMCGRIDAYLDGELLAAERGAFEIHLDQCAACREAVDEQGWIDSLLRSDAAAEIEAPRTLVLRPRPRGKWLVAAAAAAVAAAAASLLPLPAREGTGEGFPTVAEDTGVELNAIVGNPSPSPSLPGRGISEPPAATFISSGSAIAIPVASPDPQVTIVKLYPTLTASRRGARERAFRAEFTNPNGG